MRSFLERQKLSAESEKVICSHEGNDKAKEFLQNIEYWAQVHNYYVECNIHGIYPAICIEMLVHVYICSCTYFVDLHCILHAGTK